MRLAEKQTYLVNWGFFYESKTARKTFSSLLRPTVTILINVEWQSNNVTSFDPSKFSQTSNDEISSVTSIISDKFPPSLWNLAGDKTLAGFSSCHGGWQLRRRIFTGKFLVTMSISLWPCCDFFVIFDVVTANLEFKQFTGTRHCLIQKLQRDFIQIKEPHVSTVSCHITQCLLYPPQP